LGIANNGAPTTLAPTNNHIVSPVTSGHYTNNFGSAVFGDQRKHKNEYKNVEFLMLINCEWQPTKIHEQLLSLHHHKWKMIVFAMA
jgi:hypothetical protein